MTTQATVRLQVLYLHTLRDAAGTGEESLDVPEGACVGDCVATLLQRHPALAPHAASILVALNEEWVPRGHAVADGDILAMMPPVSGG